MTINENFKAHDTLLQVLSCASITYEKGLFDYIVCKIKFKNGFEIRGVSSGLYNLKRDTYVKPTQKQTFYRAISNNIPLVYYLAHEYIKDRKKLHKLKEILAKL